MYSILPEMLRGVFPPVVVGVIVMLGSFVGAYLAAYFQERGRNRATREDFDEIKRQLQETAEINSRVDAVMSRGLWVEQKRWEFREAVYLKLLELLTDAQKALTNVYKLDLEDPPRHNLEEKEKSARVKEMGDTDPGLGWRVHSWEEHLESEMVAATEAYKEIVAAAKEDLLLDSNLSHSARLAMPSDSRRAPYRAAFNQLK